jgi:UDP:flavonoid glycosyltransferase YjiC (YdhE family)
MHVIYAWELGANLGHLERGIGIAHSLRENGIQCSFVVRDIRSSARFLSTHGFLFHAAPQCADSESRSRGLSLSYSDVLLANGWANHDHLLARVRTWIGILEVLKADAILIDHSPLALLAARVMRVPIFLVGTGFDFPPQVAPLPPLLGDGGDTKEQRIEIDLGIAASINHVLDALGAPRMDRVADLFVDLPQYATTLPELDVYGVRAGVRYVGPVPPVSQKPPPKWNLEGMSRGFAYLRSHTPDLENLLEAIACSGLEFICVLPDATQDLIERFRSKRVQVLTHTVDVTEVLSSVRIVISYGSAALAAQSLLAGVPMLLVSRVPEQVMNSKRVESLGAGISITRAASAQVFATAIRALIEQPSYLACAQGFAKNHPPRATSAADDIATDIAAELQRRTTEVL